MTKLTKKELTVVEELFTKLNESEEALDRELADAFGENKAAEIRAKLEEGIDRFYLMYGKDITKTDIHEAFAQRMQGMTNVEKYIYLSNVMVALTHLSGNMMEGDAWSRSLEEHSTVLRALNMGMITEESETLKAGIEEMQALITDNVDACAVMYLGEPPYEKLFDECLEGDPADIEALAIHARMGSLHMAAAMCILQERGQLPSLGDTVIDPQSFGVMAASLMEIDAAHKSGVWDTAKVFIERACKVALTLLLTAPGIVGEALVLIIVGLITSFNLLWWLVAGTLLIVNIKIGYDQTKAHTEKLIKVGAKLMKVALNATLMVAGRLREWVRLHVVPGAVRAWERCRDFTVNRILIPAASFLIKAKEETLRAYDVVVDQVKAILTRLRAGVAYIRENAALRASSTNESDIEKNDDDIELVEEEAAVLDEEEDDAEETIVLA